MTIDEQQMQQKLQEVSVKSIFRPHKGESKFTLWWKKKVVTYLTQKHPGRKRYEKIHYWAKRRVFQPGIKLLTFLLKDHMIKSLDDIPQEWYNNHIRMFYYSSMKGIDDIWEKFIYNFKVNKKDYPTSKDYLKWIKKTELYSYVNRSNAIKILCTEFLEDTVDREWVNFFMLRMWHVMNDFYGGNVPKPGAYPMYNSTTQHNPNYFIQGMNNVVWNKENIDFEEVIKEEPNDTNKKTNGKSKRTNKKST